jgi:hypothetical protein
MWRLPAAEIVVRDAFRDADMNGWELTIRTCVDRCLKMSDGDNYGRVGIGTSDPATPGRGGRPTQPTSALTVLRPRKRRPWHHRYE